MWNVRILLLIILPESCSTQYMQSTWLSSNFSTTKLLGLFEDRSNASATDEFSVHSRAMFKAAVILSHEYNITVAGQLVGWQTVITTGDVIDTLSRTCAAVSTGNIISLIGPVLSSEAYVIAAFADKIGIPTISYAATDPDLSDRDKYPAFYRVVPSDDVAAIALTQLFLKYNWTTCTIIYQNDVFGLSALKAITEAFNQNGLKVSRTILFDISRLEIQGDLKMGVTDTPSRIVILWAHPVYASMIVQSALDLDVLGPRFTWILSTNIPLRLFNRTFNKNLIGMLTIEPTVGNVVSKPVNKSLLYAAYRVWQQYEPESFPGAANVNNYALFAFDATWTVLQSLSKLCPTVEIRNSSCISIVNSSFCFNSRFGNANALFNNIMDTEFLGVSGQIQFNPNITYRINSTYYLVQNVQLSSNILDYVPVLSWSGSDKWIEIQQSNAMVWPGSTTDIPTGIAKLTNVTLRIGVIESIPFTAVSSITDENGVVTPTLVGYAPDIISLLQARMGFIPNIVVVPLNVSYFGLVQAVANGVYDIVVADVTVTSGRREIAGFSTPIFDNSLRIIMRKKQPPSIDFTAYFGPFSINLWMALLSASIFAALLICVLERPENEELKDRSIASAITMSWWYSIGTIMGYGADFHVATAAGRLLTVGLYLLSLVLVASYTANLASDLTISKSKNIITSIDDIKNGKVPFNRVGIRVGTAAEAYYLREISQGIKNYYPLKDRPEMYDSLLKNIIDVSFMDSGTAEYVTNNIFCNLTLVLADFDKSSLAIVIPKNWLYQKDLDVNILALREQGIIDDLQKKWFLTSSCPDSSDSSTGLAIEQMSGLFLTFAIIGVLSLILFAWTNRFKVKDYVLRLIDYMFPSFKSDTSKVRRGSQISKRSHQSQRASFDSRYFQYNHYFLFL